MKNLYLTITLLLFCFISTAQKLPFQGYLEESNIPVNGTRTFVFELTDFGWTETIADVPIENGIYNVVLGETTLLPDSIFVNVSETPLSITVDGTNIGSVTIYKPLVNGKSLLGNEESLSVKGPNGELKADLNYFAPNNAGSLVLYGANDSTNVILGASSPGYEGALFLYDSVRNQHVALRSRNRGGSFLVASRASGAFRSGVSIDAFPNNSNLRMFGTNTAQDQSFLMIDQYITPNAINFGPEMSGNYQRSGTDWKDNEGRLLAAIGNTRDELGTDPTGASGYLSLWGTNSFNAELTGKRSENNDLPTLNLFGSNDDGADWWMRNFYTEVNPGGGTDNYSNLGLLNTNNGGISTETVFMTSNDNSTGAGLIEVRDSLGSATVSISARYGNINLNRPSDGRASVSMFQFNGTGGISIQDASDIGRFLFIGDEGNLILRNNTESETVRIESQTGNIVVSGTVSAQGTVLTSDKRFKKQINTLENSLSNTLKLRGTSYYWKDENKTQRKQIGVIAQEVEEVYPEFVHTNQDGYKAVNYSQMTAVLIEAIKELNAKVESLEKENETLTAALDQTKVLSEKIDKLEKLLLQDQKVASK